MPPEVSGLRTPLGHPVFLATRPDTNDEAVAVALLGQDEYRLASLAPLSGWMLDIGAHIGTIGIAAALDNPDLRVMAVEALAENAALMRDSVAMNGLTGRVFVEHAAAAAPGDGPVTVTYGYRSVGGGAHAAVDGGYVNQCRWIGNIFGADTIEQDGEVAVVDPLSLDAILDRYGIDEVALLKIDCEGCEWRFLLSPALDRVARIVGEYHDAHAWADLVALVEPTHIAQQWTTGPVGLFSATRR